jgi:hypothetical protein
MASADVVTNMQILKPSRVKPRSGDVFALRMRNWYVFGRVVSTEAKAGWDMPGAILIYIFKFRAHDMHPPSAGELVPKNLLVSPMMTNRLPWSRGYFQTLTNLPPRRGDDILALHCFRSSAGKYFDENAIELPGPVEPCGDWGLHSFRTIDDEISSALGIPRAPD